MAELAERLFFGFEPLEKQFQDL